MRWKIGQGIMAGALVLAGMAGVVRAGDSPLRMSWTSADHASGLYLAKEKAVVRVLVENLAEGEQKLAGRFVFGPKGAEKTVVEAGAAGEGVTTIVPIAESAIGAGKSVMLDVPVTFMVAGEYELHWQREAAEEVVRNAEGVELVAIFAPRGKADASNPWITLLPRAAVRTRGFIFDYAARTTVRRFVLDETYLFDPAKKTVPVIGASMEASGEEFAAMIGELKRAEGELVLRVVVPLRETAEEGSVEMLGKYVADAVKRCKGTLRAIALVPELPANGRWNDNLIKTYRAYYLAAAEAMRNADKTMVLLGAGNALQTMNLVPQQRNGTSGELEHGVDAFGITDAAWELALVKRMAAAEKKPIWLLPALPGERNSSSTPAAGLAEGLRFVALPPANVDRGATAHLLGGAVMFQRVKPDGVAYVAVFQGDGYAVAALAGLGAGTPTDVAFPQLAQGRAEVEGLARESKAEKPTLVVADDATSMRVVDFAGNSVDCRLGDELRVPVDNRVMYLLQEGNAEDLSALLRTAEQSRIPTFEPSVTVGQETEGKATLQVRLRNLSPGELEGKLVVYVMDEGKAVEIARESFVPVGAGKSLEMPVVISRALAVGAEVVLEIEAGKQRQRCAVRVAR